MSMKLMPGFKFKWYYTWGSAGEVQPDQHYHGSTSLYHIVAKAFVRKVENEFTKLDIQIQLKDTFKDNDITKALYVST